MTHTFADALALVLREEGGFVDDPRDPGGMTNLGVTAHTWEQWSGRPVNIQTMRALTPASVAPLYKAWFWNKIDGDAMPCALALPLFDFAVNAGPRVSFEAFQGIIGATVDGQPGPSTMRAAQAYITRVGLAHLIGQFSNARREHYRNLPTFATFGKGWLARVDRIEAEAIAWAS